MNTLSYAILGILARKPQSGYELGKHLETLWASKLSQIYPLLSKLEENKFVTSEHIEQFSKPNKIKYHITESGLDTFKEWLRSAPADPILRDEFVNKVYSLWLIDMDTATSLINQRKSLFKEKLTEANTEISRLEQNHKEEITAPSTEYFCSYILYKRRVRIFRDELEWCDWVLSLLDGPKSSDNVVADGI